MASHPESYLDFRDAVQPGTRQHRAKRSLRKSRADRNNWNPRVGIAYRIGDKAVLRAGFGIFHNPLLSTDRDITQGFSRVTSNIVTQPDGVRRRSTFRNLSRRDWRSPRAI